MISAVFLGLVILDALLLWVLIGLTKGWWLLKLAAIFVVVTFNFFVIGGINSGIGWPTTARIPTGALFDACVIVEPDPISNNPGAIWIWATPLKATKGYFSFTSRGAEPRAYQEPYTRALHVACLEAQKAAGQGVPMQVGYGKGRAGHQTPGRVRFYNLPRAILPSKGPGQ